MIPFWDFTSETTGQLFLPNLYTIWHSQCTFKTRLPEDPFSSWKSNLQILTSLHLHNKQEQDAFLFTNFGRFNYKPKWKSLQAYIEFVNSNESQADPAEFAFTSGQ